MKNELFFDTNILYYAYDLSEPSKRESCLKLVEKAFMGEITGVISNQVMVELFNALTRKSGVPTDKAKINYTHNTVLKTLQTFIIFKSPFLDPLISDTMKENGLTKIVTENEKDFHAIPGLYVFNPLKQ